MPVTVRTTAGDVASAATAAPPGRHRHAATSAWPGSAASRCGPRAGGRRHAPPPRARSQRLSCARAPARCRRSCRPAATSVDAESDEGKRSVRGVTAGEDAPFQIQALSSAGDVASEAGRERAATDRPPRLPPARARVEALARTSPRQPHARPRAARRAAIGAARARRRAERDLDRPAARARRAGRLPARSPSSTAARPTGCSDAHMPPLPAARRTTSGTLWRRALDALGDRGSWRVLGLRGARAAGRRRRAGRRRSFPIAVTAELLIFGVRGIGRARRRDYVGPWTLGAARRRAAARARARRRQSSPIAVARRPAHAARARSTRALLAPGARPEGPGARAAGREPRRPHALGRLLAAATARTFVDELGRPVRAARARLRPRVDGGRARRPPRRGDHPRRRAGHRRPSSSTPPPPAAALAIDNERLKADLRARVEELRVSRAAHRRGRRRRPPADRARPPRRRPAAARLARARPAAAEGAAEGHRRGRRGRRDLREARRRARRAARARARHPPRDPHRARARPAVAALAERAPVPVEADVDDRRAPGAGRSRPPPTSSSPRR